MSDAHIHHEAHPQAHNHGVAGTMGAILHLPGSHSHDHSYTALASDRALRDNQVGIRTIWLALLALGLTTVFQVIIYLSSGSVALLADTVHNLGDALNSLPLLVAFYLARRAATSRYTYGFGRAEDLAGVLIVVSIAFSGIYILLESIQKLLDPQPLTNLLTVAIAAVVGFAGNEIVAVMQIRVGKQIGSAAMIADGQHARVDGLTSLAVLIAVIGTWVGLPILDPLVGIFMAIIVLGLTWSTAKTVWYRLMDAIDPEIVHQMEHAILEVNEVKQITRLRARQSGHRLYGELTFTVDPALTLIEADRIAEQVRSQLDQTIPHLNDLSIQIDAHPSSLTATGSRL